jgi:hypothetical protein
MTLLSNIVGVTNTMATIHFQTHTRVLPQSTLQLYLTYMKVHTNVCKMVDENDLVYVVKCLPTYHGDQMIVSVLDNYLPAGLNYYISFYGLEILADHIGYKLRVWYSSRLVDGDP